MSAPVGSLIRLCGSDNDAEALSALRKLQHALHRCGRDFHWLAALAEKHLALPILSNARAGAHRPPWQSLAMEILRCCRGRLKPYEISFLESMTTWTGQPSAKQRALLDLLAQRF